MNDLILIVDDERDLVEALEYALQREGFRTSVASTGQQALTLAASPCPDLILLDLMLPDMAGTQVCLQLRADPATRAVPIVMMTAKAAEIDRVVGFEVGDCGRTAPRNSGRSPGRAVAWRAAPET